MRDDIEAKQPVYVLGAGFSKAINANMPLTDELGAVIRGRLHGEIDLSDLDSQSFEEWLTLRVAPMPFLERHVNAKRLADAERVIAEVAEVIQERTDLASAGDLPIWLAQLAVLWQVERALVVTFNYDTLLERAVNELRLTSPADGKPRVAFADGLVHPAPPAPLAAIYADLGISDEGPFQILKPHGSINWHWSSGDPTGSTLSRTRERSTFSGRTIYSGDRDTTGASMLDRFITPPVTSKSGYYSPALAQILWRSASAAIRNSTSLTLIGYSMPPADLTTVELLRGLPTSAALQLVDAFPGDKKDARSLAARASLLRPRELHVWGGPSCLSDFVDSRIAAATDAFAATLAADTKTDPHKSVLIALPNGRGLDSQGFYLALSVGADDVVVGLELNLEKLRELRSSANEAALNSHPPGRWKDADLLSYRRLREHVAKHGRLVISHGDSRRVAVSLEHARLDHTEVVHLYLAPLK